MHRRGLLVCAIVALLASLSCAVRDEAKRAGVDARQLVPQPIDPQADYFHAMDFNVVDGAPALPLSREAVAGRAMWMVWTGGNDRLWDRLTIDSIGTFDLLKIISSHPQAAAGSRLWRLRPAQPLEVPRPRQRAVLQGATRTRSEPVRAVARRARRRLSAGSVCRAQAPIPASRSARAARPFRSARTTASPPASSVCGCFPIPTSTRRRASAGTPSGSTTIPTYYFDRDLVRPYRVGMSCAFCHVGPESDQAACRSRESEVGKPELERRRAILLVGPCLQLARACTTRAACSIRRCTCRGRARSTRRSSRPTTSTIPRTMNAVYYLGPRMATREEVGQGDAERRRPAATSSSTISCRPAIRSRSSSRRRARR